jgi:hypothetical protein
VIPEEKLSGKEGRVVASPRIGEAPPTKEKEKDSKTPEPDLRRRICPNGSCKEPEPKPVETDLRRRICKDGPCVECPPGQSAGKNSTCVANTAQPNVASTQCPANQSWNGGTCVAAPPCRPGETWNGAECVNPAQCATFSSRGSLLAMDARSLRRDMEDACRKDPYGQECMRLRQSHDAALLSYEMLLNEAPVSCRPVLPDPISL